MKSAVIALFLILIPIFTSPVFSLELTPDLATPDYNICQADNCEKTNGICQEGYYCYLTESNIPSNIRCSSKSVTNYLDQKITENSFEIDADSSHMERYKNSVMEDQLERGCLINELKSLFVEGRDHITLAADFINYAPGQLNVSIGWFLTPKSTGTEINVTGYCHPQEITLLENQNRTINCIITDPPLLKDTEYTYYATGTYDIEGGRTETIPSKEKQIIHAKSIADDIASGGNSLLGQITGGLSNLADIVSSLLGKATCDKHYDSASCQADKCLWSEGKCYEDTKFDVKSTTTPQSLEISDESGSQINSPVSLSIDESKKFQAKNKEGLPYSTASWSISQVSDICTREYKANDIYAKVTGKKAGTCKLKATKDTMSDEITLLVGEGNSKDQTTNSNPTIKCTSTSQNKYECKLYDSSNNQITSGIEWSQIEETGGPCELTKGSILGIKASKKGTCVIYAKWSEKTASYSLDVNPGSESGQNGLLIGFMLNDQFFGLSDKDAMDTGEKTYYARKSGSSSNLAVVWKVSPSDICSIPSQSAVTNGVLNAKSAGTCKLTAEYSDNENLIEKSIDITITGGDTSEEDETKKQDSSNTQTRDEPAKRLEIVAGVTGEFKHGGSNGWSYEGGTVGTRGTGENWFFHGKDLNANDYVPLGEMTWDSVGPSNVCKQLTIKNDEVLVQPIGSGKCIIKGSWNGETAELSQAVVD